jgi:hypothetical protein
MEAVGPRHQDIGRTGDRHEEARELYGSQRTLKGVGG